MRARAREHAQLFTVQVLVSDQWMAIDDAQRLPREEAQVICAGETAIVGHHRVRVVPSGQEDATR